jgi:hypothetical protein
MRLAPWLASRDATFDAGESMGVRSQPWQPGMRRSPDDGRRRTTFEAPPSPSARARRRDGSALARLRAGSVPQGEPFLAG